MMKTLILLLSFAFSLYTLTVQGQNNPDIRRTYHWYFGDKAGLDFSSGTPVPITNSAMTSEEGCASISDTCGNLLFYTDGDTVWDRNNNVMPNGTGLMGCWSSTQNSLIIPQPENDSLYYIFLTDCAEHDGASGLRYSIVNMNLNGGLGEVVQKNFGLYAPVMEKLAATYHANKTDIWILSVNRYVPGPPPDTTYQYLAYLLTASGINITPVISPSQIFPHKTDDGYLRFSHSGNKIANVWHGAIDTIEYLDFNNNSGIISNSITINNDSTDIGGYGLVFSPDDSKLFYTRYKTDSSLVVQYDLSSGVSTSINNSMIIIKSGDWIYYSYTAMQVGSGDGKVYVRRFKNGDSLLDIIQNPNALGLSCNYYSDAINLQFPQNHAAGLPNFVDSYLNGVWSPPCNTGFDNTENTEVLEIMVYPNPFSDYTTIQITNPDVIETKIINLQLFDFMGHIILQTEIETNDYKIHKGNLNKGIYFLKIHTDNHTYTNKLIIN